MVSKGGLLVICHALVWTLALAFWAGGVAGASARYDTATPYAPVNKHRYIPLHSGGYDNSDLTSDAEDVEDAKPAYSYSIGGMAPSELLLTGLRTVLDVVRKINQKRSSQIPASTNTTALVLRRSRPRNGTAVETGRGMDDYYDEHHDHDYHTTTAKPMKQGRYTDPWAGYYDWIINEGSFKFWSAFQLFTAALLLYACFSAIYYAKFNPILPDYSMEYDDYFLQRTVGRSARSVDIADLPSGVSWISPQTFQFILDAINMYKQYQGRQE